MNVEMFNQEVLKKLLIASNQGDMLSETGTRLIGHSPDIAPKAYKHSVYKPLNEEECAEFCVRMSKSIPNQLLSFLKLANGLMIFDGSIRVYGYVPVNRAASTRIHNYPPNILVANSDVSNEHVIAIGWYEKDQSNVFLVGDGSVARVDVDGHIICEWNDMEEWLSKEISRLTDI